jgi:hypothetical protein
LRKLRWNPSSESRRDHKRFCTSYRQALHLADGTSEALEAIREAEALAERFEGRWWSAELHRLRGVFLAEMGADETQVKASFGEAIRTANQQKSVSLATRAEASYAEYRDRKGIR